MRNRMAPTGAFAVALMFLLLLVGCAKKQPPVARPMPPPPPEATEVMPPPEPAAPTGEAAPGGFEPAFEEDAIAAGSLDEINRNSPLQPVFYGLDVSDVDAAAQRILDANAQVLRQYSSWQISIEGHADERGTAEYNLALGERRAVAARNYLVSLGIPADRLRTVSYGKEFPFDPGHTEEAWAKNRRAHFVVTGK